MPRISQLPSLVAADGNDEIAIVDSSAATTKKITREDFLKGSDLPDDTVTTNAIADGAVTPEKRSGGFKVISKAFANTTGSQTITGVGFKPKGLTCFGMSSDSTTQARHSTGMADDSGSQFSQATFVQSGQFASKMDDTAAFISMASSGTQVFRGVVTSWDADGITVNVTASGSFALDREYRIAFFG